MRRTVAYLALTTAANIHGFTIVSSVTDERKLSTELHKTRTGLTWHFTLEQGDESWAAKLECPHLGICESITGQSDANAATQRIFTRI